MKTLVKKKYTIRARNKSPSLIGFELKQELNVRYYVRLEDYINGTMWDGNKLKAVEKGYYKQTRSGFGYKWIREKINGVEVN